MEPTRIVTELTPSEPPRLLPGRSARLWARLTFVGFMLTAVAFLALPVLTVSLADNPLRGSLINFAGMVAITLGLTACLGWWRMGARSRLELKAGYTTLSGRHYAYWELDDQTGAVRRQPAGRELPATR